MQSEFRRTVMGRDGQQCVLCRGAPPLEAAHIVARIAKPDELRAALLMGPNVASNGIMLCVPCHRLHDAFMWCFDPDRGVVVADALLHDEDLGLLWRDRVGVQLSQPSAADADKAAWWPPASVWAAAVDRFEAARVERHAKADDFPFFCGVCGKRYKDAVWIAKHRCEHVRHKLFTPKSVRSAGGGPQDD